MCSLSYIKTSLQFRVACEADRHKGVTLSSVCLSACVSVCLSVSHTLLVVTLILATVYVEIFAVY